MSAQVLAAALSRQGGSGSDRLVQFQLERDVRDSEPLPASLRSGRILSAVYRVTAPGAKGGRQGLALRLMVDPKRRGVEVAEVQAATA